MHVVLREEMSYFFFVKGLLQKEIIVMLSSPKISGSPERVVRQPVTHPSDNHIYMSVFAPNPALVQQGVFRRKAGRLALPICGRCSGKEALVSGS